MSHFTYLPFQALSYYIVYLKILWSPVTFMRCISVSKKKKIINIIKYNSDIGKAE